MTPAGLLHGMRAKGYSLARDGARLLVSGPKPPDRVWSLEDVVQLIPEPTRAAWGSKKRAAALNSN